MDKSTPVTKVTENRTRKSTIIRNYRGDWKRTNSVLSAFIVEHISLRME